MTTRKLAAETTGPISLDVSLLQHGGTITVRAEADCDRATLTLHTTDEQGPAAEAVQTATLRQSATGLHACVQGTGGGTITQTIRGGHGGGRIVQHVSNNVGSMVAVSAGDLNISGGVFHFNGGVGGTVNVLQGSAPIEITAVVPEGSSLLGRSQSADIVVEGAVLNITAQTQSGDVRMDGHAARVTASTQSGDVLVAQAANINAKTQSGDLRLGRTDVVEGKTMSGDITIADFGGTAHLTAMSGDIRVHATAGGDLRASTISGDVHVTATDTALTDDLDVQADSVSGSVQTPQRRRSAAGPRRRNF
ncbi:DUF4097 family beta strand repeat-containing protein [Streptomyces sp. VTCC 41912]|uniref:DUF4097 family beta strand repeat-containing protein n=1 Tax=Streptomyces sp. VTCC 41912 TaxID=3383243 RepID=UPI003896D598